MSHMDLVVMYSWSAGEWSERQTCFSLVLCNIFFSYSVRRNLATFDRCRLRVGALRPINVTEFDEIYLPANNRWIPKQQNSIPHTLLEYHTHNMNESPLLSNRCAFRSLSPLLIFFFNCDFSRYIYSISFSTITGTVRFWIHVNLPSKIHVRENWLNWRARTTPSLTHFGHFTSSHKLPGTTN